MLWGLRRCADDQVKLSSLYSFCCSILVGFPGLLQYADYSSWLRNHSPGEFGVFGKSSVWSGWMLLPRQPRGHRFTHYHDWWSRSPWLGWVFLHITVMYVLWEHIPRSLHVSAWSQRRASLHMSAWSQSRGGYTTRVCMVTEDGGCLCLLLCFSVPRKQDPFYLEN